MRSRDARFRSDTFSSEITVLGERGEARENHPRERL